MIDCESLQYFRIFFVIICAFNYIQEINKCESDCSEIKNVINATSEYKELQWGCDQINYTHFSGNYILNHNTNERKLAKVPSPSLL